MLVLGKTVEDGTKCAGSALVSFELKGLRRQYRPKRLPWDLRQMLGRSEGHEVQYYNLGSWDLRGLTTRYELDGSSLLINLTLWHNSRVLAGILVLYAGTRSDTHRSRSQITWLTIMQAGGSLVRGPSGFECEIGWSGWLSTDILVTRILKRGQNMLRGISPPQLLPIKDPQLFNSYVLQWFKYNSKGTVDLGLAVNANRPPINVYSSSRPIFVKPFEIVTIYTSLKVESILAKHFKVIVAYDCLFMFVSKFFGRMKLHLKENASLEILYGFWKYQSILKSGLLYTTMFKNFLSSFTSLLIHCNIHKARAK